MLLVDMQPLSSEALNDKQHKLHDFAKKYEETLKYLRERHGNGFIRFKRPGYPRHTKGADGNFREIPKMKEPTPPMIIPLHANAVIGSLGKHHIDCCLDAPTILPNGLWDLGRRKTISIKEDKLININEEPDLAFFLYEISPHTKKKRLVVVDPAKDDMELGEAERILTERKYAVWNMLSDDTKLRMMARAYGVANVDSKQPNAIRKELDQQLEKNDSIKRRNPAVKGTKEFVEEMQVTEGLLLRNFVQKNIDEKRLTYSPSGHWKIGDKIVIQVPANMINQQRDYLCNYLMAGNNEDKLKEFLRDLVDSTYLDNIVERKEWEWLAKVAGVQYNFKKLDDIKTGVYKFYAPM